MRKPRKPKSPDVDKCCCKDCKNCFLNPYFEKMEIYEEQLALWQAQQNQLKKEKEEKPKKKKTKIKTEENLSQEM